MNKTRAAVVVAAVAVAALAVGSLAPASHRERPAANIRQVCSDWAHHREAAAIAGANRLGDRDLVAAIVQWKAVETSNTASVAPLYVVQKYCPELST